MTSKITYKLLCLLLVTSCGTLKDDIAPGYAKVGYNSVHFQFNQQNYFGILPIVLKESEPLPRSQITIKLFWKGTIRFFSRACEIDQSFRFDGDFLFPITQIRDCLISVNVMPDSYKKLSHTITEIGQIQTLAIPQNVQVLNIDTSIGLHAMQVVKGLPSIYQKVSVTTPTESGLIVAVGTNGKEIKRSYNARVTYFSLSELWGSDNSVNWYFKATPSDGSSLAIGKLSIGTYEPTRVPLESTAPSIIGDRLDIFKPEYLIAIDINGKVYTKNNISVYYSETRDYLITAITKTGRKSVVLYRGGQLIWQGF